MKGLLGASIAATLLIGWAVIRKLNKLLKEQQNMSQNVSKISASAEKIAQDVENIKRWQQKQMDDKAALQKVIDDQKTLIEDLKGQIEAGKLDDAALSTANEKLEAADTALDAIQPDQPPVVETPAETPAGTTTETPVDTSATGTGSTETPGGTSEG